MMATATIEPKALPVRRPPKSAESENDGTRESVLKLMRKPFEPHQISTMCKSTKKDNPQGRCNACGGWHKLPAVQISYVGHAALTDRLLDADPEWTWEPLAYAPNGTPLLDADGGMWIKLTVGGITRLGYGDAQGKSGGDAMKERIGDALRNAAMRFGAALDLWHKGNLHLMDEGHTDTAKNDAANGNGNGVIESDWLQEQCEWFANAKDRAELDKLFKAAYSKASKFNDRHAQERLIAAKDARKREL